MMHGQKNIKLNKETNPREKQGAADPTLHSALQPQLYDANEPPCYADAEYVVQQPKPKFQIPTIKPNLAYRRASMSASPRQII
jgi:hypothetical protein